MNDTVGNENVTINSTFTIDGTKPNTLLVETNTSNGSVLVKGAQINLSAQWYDNIALQYWWIEYNDTSATAANRSYTPFSPNLTSLRNAQERR